MRSGAEVRRPSRGAAVFRNFGFLISKDSIDNTHCILMLVAGSSAPHRWVAVVQRGKIVCCPYFRPPLAETDTISLDNSETKILKPPSMRSL